MSRLFSFLVAAVIIASAVALASLLVSRAPQPERVEPPAQIPYVQTGTVRAGAGPIPVYGAGTVRAGADVAIAPQVGGKVVWVEPGFRSGGRVPAGQTLFRIEQADYLYLVQEAEANLAARRVALLEEQEQAQIARAEYERYTAQLADHAGQPEVSPLTLREPQLAVARAELKRAEALLADARLALSRTRVTAPFDGHVRAEAMGVGQVVSAGQAVGRLLASDLVEVVVPLSDRLAALIPGLWELVAGDGNQDVRALVTARYGAGRYGWKGYVDRGETLVDELTRTIDVVVRVPDPFRAGIPVGATAPIDSSPPLLPGEFVEVEIAGMTPENYFRAPRAALQPGNELWVVRPGGKVSIVPVQVLQRAADEVYVTGDLQGGQAVITDGIQFVTEGMQVRTGADPAP